ncbi:MAG: class I SAM-dependent methyltransferase [Anaerolineae bacterium]|jgi:SAM-dependent methyltransferase|nr:class I SAM-dependent methyltransferase [Anaerolineae bacterium]
MAEHYNRAAERGVPSLVWRAGQQRRLEMIRQAAGERMHGSILVDGCGLGTYLERLAEGAEIAAGLDIEFERVREAHENGLAVVCGAGEHLPFVSERFDLVLSHEVLEHVADDRQSMAEMLRVLKPGGRLALFVPNRGYPFETHGIYWRGKYHFGNIPLVNYLPRRWRDRLAPHVRLYTRRNLKRLLAELPAQVIVQTTIFGGYDNIIGRFPRLGRLLRGTLQALERTPLRALGLSHFWVIEKTAN